MGVAELIVLLASVMFVGFLWWFFFGPKQTRPAEVRAGLQQVTVTVKGGYSPDRIRVQQGVPLRLTFDRQEAGDCTSRVVFADFGASKSLPAFGTTSLDFTPDKVGEFDFSCGMNMIHGTLVVEPTYPDTAAPIDSAREVAQAVGVGPSTDQGVSTEQIEFRVGGISCASCVARIETALNALPGVDRADVSFGTERATVEYDPDTVTPDQLQAAVSDAGYRLIPREAPGSAETEDHEAAERRAETTDLARRVVIGAVLAAPVVFAVMAVDLFGATWMPGFMLNRWFQLALITPVMFYSGWPLHRTGWLTLHHRPRT